MRCAVIGCGVGGIAAALALARRGHEVALFEAFDTPRPLGSGLLLQPSGLRALEALGLAETVLASGAPIYGVDGRNARGRPVLAMRYDDWREGAFGLGIHRAALFDALYQSLTGGGVALRTGVRITGVREPERPVLIDAEGQTHGPFDMAVCADGHGSALRQVVRPNARARPYRWGAVFANVRDDAQRFPGLLHQRYEHAQVMMGVLPIGRGPAGETDLCALFWSLPVSDHDTFLAGDLAAWRRRATLLWPEAGGLIDQITGADAFSRAAYRDVQAGRWSEGGLILIGDAAHGASPQLGQGANLALIDAVELAARLDETHAPVPQRLRRIQAIRRRQTSAYQLISRWLTPLFQSDGRLGPWFRDQIFGPLSQWPGVRRMGALVLTGALRFGRAPPGLKP